MLTDVKKHDKGITVRAEQDWNSGPSDPLTNPYTS